MSNTHDDLLDDEPPPSYQEATGTPSFTHRPDPAQPPPLPPRNPSKQQQPQAHPQNTNGQSSASTGSPSSQHAPAQTFNQLLPTISRQFPPTINLYRDAFPGAPLQRRLFLGEHQHSPLYAVGIFISAVVLHNGPSDDFPPLATVAYGGVGRRIEISLPPLTPTSPATPPIVATITRGSFAFGVEVPDGGGGFRRERFEWRRSSNSIAVATLGGATQGWKLVRLSNELLAGSVAMGAGSGPPSGDGHEVVAVCTSAVMSLTKLWKFCFLGTGVSGALGERWAVMAVVTGLIIWERENRR